MTNHNQPEKSAVNGIIDTHLNEYRVMREEISLYQQQQNQAVSFCIVVLVGFLTLLSEGIFPSANTATNAMLLLLPVFILVVGLLHIDRTMRINRIGGYIHNVLRIRIIAELEGHDVLLWEAYKRVVSDEYKGVEKWMIWTLERIRVTIFLFLFFVPLFLYAMAKYQQIPFVSPTLIEFVLFFVNAGIFLVFVVFAWKPQETKGADTNVSLLEKVLAKSHQQRGVK